MGKCSLNVTTTLLSHISSHGTCWRSLTWHFENPIYYKRLPPSTTALRPGQLPRQHRINLVVNGSRFSAINKSYSGWYVAVSGRNNGCDSAMSLAVRNNKPHQYAR